MLGRQLIEYASAERVDFEEYVRMRFWKVVSSQLESLGSALTRNKAQPTYWAEDCEHYLEAYERWVAKAPVLLPYDLCEGRSTEEARALPQQLVRQFGELLVHWPDILKAAITLRARGIRLAIAV
jgi:hypothetical protein